MNIKINVVRNKNSYSHICVFSLKNNKYRNIDKIGIINKKYNYVLLNSERLYAWIAVGAQLSKRVEKILKWTNKIPY